MKLISLCNGNYPEPVFMSILAQGFLSESCILAKLCKGGRVPTSWLPRLHKEVSFGLKSSATSRILFVDERALVGTISEIPFLLTPPRSHPPPPPPTSSSTPFFDCHSPRGSLRLRSQWIFLATEKSSAVSFWWRQHGNRCSDRRIRIDAEGRGSVF